MTRAPSRPALADPGPTVAEQDEPAPAPGSEVSADPEKPRTILPCLLPASLRGVVVDPEGSGVADVVVRAEFTFHIYCTLFGTAAVQCSTDGAGTFALEPPQKAAWAVVTVDAPGWVEPEPRKAWCGYGTTVIRGPRGARDDVPPGSKRSATTFPADSRAIFRSYDSYDGRWPEMKIVLERGWAVEGTVETEAGIAVAGALVTALWHDDQPGWRYSETCADDRGRFSILVPAVSFLSSAGVSQVGIEPEIADEPRAWAGPVSPGTRVRLVMRDLASLELRVRGLSGPIEGATLTFLPSCGRPSVRRWPEYDEASGTLWLDHLLPGTYDVEVDPDEPDCLPTRAFVSVPGPPVEIQCPLAMRIEGFLEGDDVDGFKITWTGPGRNSDARFLESEGDGEESADHFLLEGVGDGVGDLYARREGDPRCAFLPGCSPVQGCLRLALAEGQAIRGRIEARPGTDLSALRIRAVAGLLTQEAEVSGDGSFAIVGLPALAFRVELRSEEWLHDARDGVLAGAGDVRLRVRLPATEPVADGF